VKERRNIPLSRRAGTVRLRADPSSGRQTLNLAMYRPVDTPGWERIGMYFSGGELFVLLVVFAVPMGLAAWVLRR
jgi:hypothetical protein